MRSLVSMSSNVIAASIISNVVQTKELFCASSVVGNVETGIMSLNLPKTLEENMKKLAQPVIGEVQLYNYYVSMCGVKFDPNFVSRLFFTMKGKLDYKLSTREVVLDENLDIKLRVILACKFCFEVEILVSWKSQPDLLRQLMKQEEASSLTGCWLKYLEEMEEPTGEFVWKDSVLLETAFLAAVEDINLEGAEYFFDKMAAVPNDNKIRILRGARISFYPDHFPCELKSIFIHSMKYFLTKSLLQECTLSLKNNVLETEALAHRYGRLKEKYAMLMNRKAMLKNKKLNSDKEMGGNEEMSKAAAEKLNKEIEMLDNEVKILNEEIEIVKNECEISINNCGAMTDECNVLLNEMRMLV